MSDTAALIALTLLSVIMYAGPAVAAAVYVLKHESEPLSPVFEAPIESSAPAPAFEDHPRAA